MGRTTISPNRAVAKNEKGKAKINASGGLDKLVQHDTNAMVDAIYNVTFGTNRKFKFFQPYLVSFCAHRKDTYERRNGLLSQWRAYGRDSGYAIVFDTKGLTDIIAKEAASHNYDIAELGDVVYEGDDRNFDGEFPKLVKSINETAS